MDKFLLKIQNDTHFLQLLEKDGLHRQSIIECDIEVKYEVYEEITQYLKPYLKEELCKRKSHLLNSDEHFNYRDVLIYAAARLNKQKLLDKFTTNWIGCIPRDMIQQLCHTKTDPWVLEHLIKKLRYLRTTPDMDKEMCDVLVPIFGEKVLHACLICDKMVDYCIPLCIPLETSPYLWCKTGEQVRKLSSFWNPSERNGLKKCLMKRKGEVLRELFKYPQRVTRDMIFLPQADDIIEMMYERLEVTPQEATEMLLESW